MSNSSDEDFKMRRCAWVGMCMLACGTMVLSGCGDQGPKSGGVKTVAPPVDPKPPATTPTPETKSVPETKAVPPANAGSTTGGGVETPDTPGDGN